ncbi:MAG: hypothetical protein LKF10_07835 [Eubacterium sp.]|nr:hypothetical protein [Eubacterium sp.]
MNQELLRKLPKVDEILSDERVQQAAAGLAHEQAGGRGEGIDQCDAPGDSAGR